MRKKERNKKLEFYFALETIQQEPKIMWKDYQEVGVERKKLNQKEVIFL